MLLAVGLNPKYIRDDICFDDNDKLYILDTDDLIVETITVKKLKGFIESGIVNVANIYIHKDILYGYSYFWGESFECSYLSNSFTIDYSKHNMKVTFNNSKTLHFNLYRCDEGLFLKVNADVILDIFPHTFNKRDFYLIDFYVRYFYKLSNNIILWRFEVVDSDNYEDFYFSIITDINGKLLHIDLDSNYTSNTIKVTKTYSNKVVTKYESLKKCLKY